MAVPKRILQNLGLISISLLVALLIGEVAIRALKIGFPRHTIMLNGKVLKNKPHTIHWQRSENVNLVKLNNWGFHDQEQETRAEGYQVLFMGDSMLEGKQVPVDSLFTSHVRRAFDQTGQEVQIINGGISGTGTAYQYTLWHEFFKPDIPVDHIVLCFYMWNDLRNNHDELGHTPGNFAIFVDSQGEIYQNVVAYPFLQEVARNVSNYSALTNTVYERLHLLKRSILRSKREKNLARAQFEQATVIGSPEAWEETVQATLTLIRKWHHELIEDDIQLSIMVMGGDDFYSDITMQHPYKNQFLQRLKTYCDETQIALLQLTFPGYTPNEVRFSVPDPSKRGHFNYLGHRLAGEKLFAWLTTIPPFAAADSSMAH